MVVKKGSSIVPTRDATLLCRGRVNKKYTRKRTVTGRLPPPLSRRYAKVWASKINGDDQATSGAGLVGPKQAARPTREHAVSGSLILSLTAGGGSSGASSAASSTGRCSAASCTSLGGVASPLDTASPAAAAAPSFPYKNRSTERCLAALASAARS